MEGINGCTIIDDSYNANPTSVIASLEMLSTATKGKKIAILGVMAEVADEAVAHRQVAQFAAMRGIDVVAVDTPLYGIGSMTAEEAVAFVHSLQEPSHVLVKGSRVAKLERVVRQIVAK
jgi:UDP-N-acetylmuramoyl-tripeptide--D-alanyl-D-alanine ligase